MATGTGGATPLTPNSNAGGAPPEQGDLGKNPSFVFSTAKGLGTEPGASAPLPLPPLTFTPPPPSSAAPRVGAKAKVPGFLDQISDSSEDEGRKGASVGKGKTDSKPAKPNRPSSLVLEAAPGLATLVGATFVSPSEVDEAHEGVEAEKPEKKSLEDQQKGSASGSTTTKAATDVGNKLDTDALLDEILRESAAEKKAAVVPAAHTPAKSANSSLPEKPDAGTVTKKEVESKSNKPALPVSTSEPQPPKPDSSLPAPPPKPDSSKPASLPPPPPPPRKLSKGDPSSSSPPPEVPPVTSGVISSSAPQPDAKLPKLDPFSPISSKKKRVKKDSDDEADVNIDGTDSPKSTKVKQSPRSPRSDKKKRRSQRDAVLTLQPRYVPQTRERKIPAQAQAALQQCQSLLNLLEEGCGTELRHALLGELVEMVFRVPKQDRDEMLERAWRCARTLPDAQLRQWAHQALSACEKVRAQKDDDSSDEESGASKASYSGVKQAYDDLCREVETAATRKTWNDLAKQITNKQWDAQTRLMATAVALDSINGLDDSDIGKAIRAFKKQLGAKLLVLAFFQSTACPGVADLRKVIAHTPAAVLRGILAGDEDALAEFREMVKAGSVATGLEKPLIECAEELVKQRGSGQQGDASSAPVTTSAQGGNASSTTSSTSVVSTGGSTLSRPVALADTQLDIVMEMLLLEGQTNWPDATGLPDQTICRLIALLECDRKEALRIVSSVAYDNVGRFINAVCESVLTPLSCGLLLESNVVNAEGKRVPSLLRHMAVDGNVSFAREYLKKLAASGISKTDLVSLLRSPDVTGVTALEAAISKGRGGNVACFVHIVSELTGLTVPEKLVLLGAQRVDSTPALLGAMQTGGAQLEKNVYAYLQGLLKFDAKYVREVLTVLSAPDKEGNPPLRLAMMNEHAGVVVSMVRAICEDENLLDPIEKKALLSGETPEADGGAGYSEVALTEYYRAVKAKFEKKFPRSRIPKESNPQSEKTFYFNKGEDAFDKPLAVTNQMSRHARDEARAKSQHAMMSMLSEDERQDLKKEGQRLMRAAQAKAFSAFHMALRKGKAQSVAAYIKTILEYAGPDSQVAPLNFILAKDADGNSALFNAMANDEAGAVEAYVDAVLASTLAFANKEHLLLQHGEVATKTAPKKYSPLQVAMGSLHYRAMHAYIAAVLRSSLTDDEKQQLLLAVGGDGKSARQMVLEFAQKTPQTYGRCLQMFDEMIDESTLKPPVKKFLTQGYKVVVTAKKS